jgi:hypothetical protein
MRRVQLFIVGAALNLLFNATASLIDRPLAIRITRWGWLYFFLHLTYLVASGKSGRKIALRFRQLFGNQVVISYVVVAMCGAGLAIVYWIGINSVYERLFSTERQKSEKSNTAAERPPTLADLFKSDFGNTMKFTDEDRIGIQWNDGSVLNIKTQVYADFPAKTQFVGFYVPPSPKALEACLRLVDAVQETMRSMHKRLAVRAGYRDEGNTLQELTFSGRVLLYHEDFLSIPQKATIIHAYSEQHLDVQFRGPDYLGDQVIAWHRQH